jgi:hypothetical protein
MSRNESDRTITSGPRTSAPGWKLQTGFIDCTRDLLGLPCLNLIRPSQDPRRLAEKVGASFMDARRGSL